MKRRKAVLHFKKSKIASLNAMNIVGGTATVGGTIINCVRNTDVNRDCGNDTRTTPKTDINNPCGHPCGDSDPIPEGDNNNSPSHIGTTP